MTKLDPIEALAAELVDDFAENDPSKKLLSREEQIERVAASIRAVVTRITAAGDTKIDRIVDAAAKETARGRAARRKP